MPKFEDKRIEIVDETEEMFGLRLGPETFYIDRAELQEKVHGKMDIREMLLNNMAVRLALSNSDAHSPNMKTIIEGATFKGPK